MHIKNDMSIVIKCTVLGICLCFNAFALVTLTFGDQSVSQWQKAKKQSIDIKQEIEDTDQRNMRLSEEIRLLQSDNTYLEKVIRQQLKYVKDEEILYVFEQKQAKSELSGAHVDE